MQHWHVTWTLKGPGEFELPSGRRLRGRRISAPLPETPDWGLYLAWRETQIIWPHQWIRWPDFGLPVDHSAARGALAEAWERSAEQRVEVACGGGRGRTGTALAAIAMLDGLDRDEAVQWVRARYDPHAVETPWQHWWLSR